MSGSEQPMAGGGDDGVVLSLATTNGFIVAATILLLILFIFSFILCLRAKRRWGGNAVADADEDPLAKPSGLDADSLKTLPWTVLRPDDFAGGAEHCAVCLSEFSLGQEARVLPNCRHSFHVECIDGWFVSHTTCPLCRAQAAPKAVVLPRPPPSIPSAPQGAVSRSSFPSSERTAEALTSLRRLILRSGSRSVNGPIDGDVEQGCVLPKSTPAS